MTGASRRGLRAWGLVLGLVLLTTSCGTRQGGASLVADAGPDRTVRVGETVVLDAGASRGEIVSYAWSLEERPEGSRVRVQDADAATARFTPDLVGAYRVTLVVSDGRREASDEVLVTTEAAEGVRLGGDPRTLAVEAVYDLDVPVDASERYLSDDPDSGLRILRTEITVEFVDEAVVGDVEALLDEVGGTIVSMTRGLATIVVRIPDPGSLTALEELLEAVEGRAQVAAAWWSWLEDPPSPPEGDGDALEATALPPLGTVARLDHHQAVRGHGAWNAREALPALADRPWVLVADWFGDGTPGDGHDLQAPAADFTTGSPWRHGYHVLGILGGRYGDGASTTARSDVTGMMPDAQRGRAIDLAGPSTGTRMLNRLVQRMNAIVGTDADARIVVNTSLGFTNPTTVPAGDLNKAARTYVRLLRNNDLEDRVVHVTAAGNTDCLTTQTGPCPAANVVRWDASINSEYTYAALGELRSWLGTRIDNLDNVLVVENRANTPASGLQRPVPACAADGSIMGGNISAIGRRVFSFGRPTLSGVPRTNPNGDGRGATSTSGTSMATPQVAGLAAYAWALNPGLTGPEVAALLRRTARNDYDTTVTGNAGARGCNATAPRPVIDALDAVLAAGGDDVRAAMLDVADAAGAQSPDGRFDEHDLRAFAAAFEAAPVLDYGRFDLNGDGVRDGDADSARGERFDLDGDLRYGAVSKTILGVPFRYQEASVRDADVLCYFAYSPLYQGSEPEREALLAERCGLVEVEIVDPAEGATFPEGEPVGFVVEVDIEGSFSGDVILSTGGVERDRLSGYSYLDDWPITTLSTRRICPGDPVATVAFEDPATNLRATDTVTLDIVANTPSVSIGGPDPRDLRVVRPSPGADPEIAPFDLAGKASDPDCEDPFSTRVDQSGLNWIDPAAQATVARGPTARLDGTYLADGAGGFREREIELRARIDGTFAQDELTLRPCTSTLGLPAGASSVEGYPECPLGGVIGDVLDALRSTFGTIDPSDVDRIVGVIVNGDPLHRDLLDELGFEPCDPRFCDPFPPEFPMSAAELRNGYYGDRGLDVTDYLDRLFQALASSTLEGAGSQLNRLRLDVAVDEGLSDPDRRLFAAAVGAAEAALTAFSPSERGGDDAWRRFGFAGDPATLSGRVDVLAPARRAVEGLLTAVVRTNAREEIGGPVQLTSASYAASLEALAQAMRAAAEVSLGAR